MISSPWRIVFFGTPAFALPSLQGLWSGLNPLVAVVTQPDREKGRGRRMLPPPVKEFALRHAIGVLQPESVGDPVFLESLRGLRPDLVVVVAYGQILPKALLEIPRYGVINVHASLLPRYRGAAPIAWAILRGEEVTGVTTLMVDEGVDTGDILMQKETPIQPEETAGELSSRLSQLGSELLRETLARMKAGDLKPTPQDHSRATYAPTLRKEDGRINWGRDAEEIDRRVRAFDPWPGAFTVMDRKFFKIWRGEPRPEASGGEPGVVGWVGSDFIEVTTGKGCYRIREIQPEGKRRMSVKDFLSGYPVRPGTLLG